jgi:hypothetical protein
MLSITPDQLAGAGAYIAEFSSSCRVEEIESPTRAVSLFHVVAGDGSRFTVLVDKWGNCLHSDTHCCQTTAERSAFLTPRVAAMHANAMSN